MSPSPVLVKAAKVVVAAAVVVGMGWSLASLAGPEVGKLAAAVWPALPAVLTLCCVYRVCNAHGWWLVLRAQRQTLPPATALRIWLSSEACRWLPGSVWSFGSRTLLGVKAGIGPLAAGSSLALELVLTMAAWAAVRKT